MLFEVTDLSSASPSVIAQCPLVCVDMSTVGWRSIWENWGVMAKQRWVINATCWQVLELLVSAIFPATIRFLSSCDSALRYGVRGASQPGDGVHEVQSFLRVFSAMLDKHLLREEAEKQLAKQLKAEAQVAVASPKAGRKLSVATAGTRQSNMTYASSRLEDVVPHYLATMRTMFAFAYAWGFGGGLHDRYDLLMK